MLFRALTFGFGVALVVVFPCAAAAAAPVEGRAALLVEALGPGIPEQAASAVRDAVLPRIAGRPPGDPPIHIVLRAETAEIRAGALRREIPIGSWISPQAARTVALHVMDLLQPTPALTPVSAPSAIAAGALAAAPGMRAASTRVTVVGGPRFGHGLAESDPWAAGFTLDVDLGWPRFSAGIGAAWSHGAASGSPPPIAAGYDVISGRLTAAVSVRRAIGAHGGLGFIFMNGSQSWTTTTLVAAPFVRSRVTLAENLALVIEAGVEVSSRPARLLVGERTLYSTPQAAPYLGLTLAWTVRS